MTPEAVKQYVQREVAKVTSKAADAIGALQAELAGALLVNWALVKQAGGSIELPTGVMHDRPAGAQLKVHFDPERDVYELSCVEPAPLQEGAGTPE